eukprot:9335356-Pyramimonas_sp.AAC.1
MDSLPAPRRSGTARRRHRSDWRRFVGRTAPHGHLDRPQRVDDRPVGRRERLLIHLGHANLRGQ